MSQEREQKSGQGRLTWVTIVVIVPVLYVLSIGPVGSVTKTPTPFLAQLYYPVKWLHDHTPLKKPLEAYARFWGFT